MRHGSLKHMEVSLFGQKQEMEYSHYAIKVAYHAHTQHGGRRLRKNALEQTYQHWHE